VANLLAPTAKAKFFDNNGRPASGYKLFTYAAGTNTKLDTYVAAGGGLNTNPIILDFRGEANVWLPPNVAYKLVFSPPSDSDPPTAPIWTVDNIVDSQLVTLYGGVDTGIANAYVLDFVANFTSYTDGIVIYWLPSNTNTGASTINVNGLGPVAIVDQGGSALTAGVIVANQTAQIVFRSGSFYLLSASTTTISGSFSAAFSGLTVPVSANITYARSGNSVTLSSSAPAGGTSNATTFFFTGLPTFLRPIATLAVNCGSVSDNSVSNLAARAIIGNSTQVTMEIGGVTGTRLQYNSAGWTAAGSKQLDSGWTVTYPII
jgi:hypothetical protein